MRMARRIFLPVLVLFTLTTCEEFPADPTGTDQLGPVNVSITTVDWPETAPLAGSVTLAVAITDPQGRTIMDPPVSWSVDTPDAGEIVGGSSDTEVSFRGTALGWVRITVTVDDPQERFAETSMTDSVTVALAGVRITVPGGDTALTYIDQTLDVQATAIDADGNPVPYDGIQWDLSGPGAVAILQAVGTQLRVQSVSQGADTVWARVPGACTSGTCETFAVVTVEQVPTEVVVTPAVDTVELEGTTRFSAEARDGGGYGIPSISFDWSSDDTGVATVDGTGLVTGQAEGETSITATVTGTGVAGSALLTVIRGRGDVTGTVYRDDDASGTFDAGADTPLAGAPVTLVRGTSPTGPEVASVQTDASGAYGFIAVPAGDYVVVVTPVPGTVIDPASKPVTVVEHEISTVEFTFTGAPVGPIGDARAAAVDEIVAVNGVVTSATSGDGVLSDSVFQMQDGTAAIAVALSAAEFPGGLPVLAIGDSVRVVGVRSETAHLLVTIQASSVTSLGTGRADTLDIRAYDVNEYRWPERLAQLRNAVIDSVTGTRSEFVWASDPEDGDADFLMYLNLDTGLNGDTAFTVGRAYTVTGIITRRNDSYRLKPRMATDIQPGWLPPTPIADARMLADSAWVSVVGVVTAGTSEFSAQTFYLQDGTAGIYAFMLPDSFPGGLPVLNRGDSVRIQGQRIPYNDEVEIHVLDVAVEGTAAVPAPVSVTASDINMGLNAGQLVYLSDVHVDSLTGGASQNVWLSDDRVGGEDVALYIDADTGIDGPGTFLVGHYYDITGLASRYLTTFQLKPRDGFDVTEVLHPIPVADARLAGLGTELAVTGVISAASGVFDPDVAFMQDATGGIQLFFPGADFPTPPTLALGDSVRVAGFRSEFNGTTRIDVYELQTFGGGFPVDTVPASVEDVAGGVYHGRLVRLDGVEVRRSSYNFKLVRDTLGWGVWVNLEPSALSYDAMGVGGIYDLVGIAFLDGSVNAMHPRTPADIGQLKAPDNLWLSFVNVPTAELDSVSYSYTSDITEEVYVGAVNWLLRTGRTVPPGNIAYAWGGHVSTGVPPEYRSLDRSVFLNDSANVDVVACLYYSCASGGGTVQGSLTRNAPQAAYDMYGLFPSQENGSDNSSLATAQFLDMVLEDQVERHQYWAHTGTVDSGGDVSDFYAFYVEAGSTITAEILSRRVGAEGNLDSKLWLYDPAGSQIGYNDDDPNSSTLDSWLQLTATSSGYYYVEVSMYSGAGVYNLRIQVDY